MSDLMAGYGEKTITPSLGVALTGYGYYLDRKAESMLDELMVRVLFIRQGASGVILISCDLLGLAIEYTNVIRNEIAAEHKIPVQHILLACTHTHSGPVSQPLRGLGDPDSGYLCQVAASIKTAVQAAVADLRKAACSCHMATVEPIGFNRRSRCFDPIDPVLKMIVFKRDNETICLLNYACHPVTLGASKEISPDWPGALVREIEKSGQRGIVFQGFCGDINPVVKPFWKGAGAGTPEDILFYGALLGRRALMLQRKATTVSLSALNVIEQQVTVPLCIPDRESILKEEQHYIDKYKDTPGIQAFISEWRKEALGQYDEIKENPRVSIPIQAIALGPLKILGLPGEIFCRYGLRLRETWPLLVTLGYSGGNMGYFPTASAYQTEDDYACYGAPKIYGLFPFSPEIEDIVVNACLNTLASL